MSFLQLIQARTINRARSFAWNSAIPLIEAGIEEAFTHLHDDTNHTANGWIGSTNSGNAIYQKTRTNSDGSYYTVTISNVSSAPIIYSQGFVKAPLRSGHVSRKVRITSRI